MRVTEPVKEQLVMLEDVIESTIENNLPPAMSKFIFINPMYLDYLEKVENILVSFMNEETGMIDGVQANETLKMMYPTVANWIGFPKEDFYLKDMINQLAIDLIGREVL